MRFLAEEMPFLTEVTSLIMLGERSRYNPCSIPYQWSFSPQSQVPRHDHFDMAQPINGPSLVGTFTLIRFWTTSQDDAGEVYSHQVFSVSRCEAELSLTQLGYNGFPT